MEPRSIFWRGIVRVEDFLAKRVLRRDSSELIVYLLIFVYTILLSYFTIQKYYAFNSFAWDFGNYHQALWTTLNGGKLFYFTPELYQIPSGSFFGLHFSPILFLLLPVYAAYQTPGTLFVFQSFIIALGALPLYWFTRDSLKSRLAAVGFSAVYLLYPPLQGANWFDFHTQAFLPLFFFSAIYCLKKEKAMLYFAFIILALAVAESVPIVVLFIGFYALWIYRKAFLQTIKQKTVSDKRILIPFVTIVLALSYLIFARWIKSTFFPIDPRFSTFYYASDFWRVLGVAGDPILMPLQIVTNPSRAFQALTFDANLKLIFILLIFGPVLFLSFRSSIVIITLGWLGPALLSNHKSYYVLGIHYPLYFIPFVFLAAVEGTKKLVPTLDIKKLGVITTSLLIIGVASSLLVSPLSPLVSTTATYVSFFSEYHPPVITTHDETLQKIVELVPPNASILTQNNIFPQVSGRLNAYVLPLPNAVNFAPNEMNAYVDELVKKSEYILIDTKTDSYAAAPLIFSRLSNQTFKLIANEDDIYLFKAT